MKRQNNIHHYVVKYHKCVRQLKRLELTGRNEHRQSILKKHIVRLLDRLNNLYLGLQKHKVATALACTTLLAVPNAQAQIKFSKTSLPSGITSLNIEGYSAPALSDLDGDGDADLLVGGGGGNLIYFQNTGTPTQANFTEGSLGTAFIAYSPTPSLSDLDNDGDYDLLVGDYYGKFTYFRNTGTATQHSFEEATLSTLSDTDIGYGSTPTFVDLDGDGDVDLLTGDARGGFTYFQNTGTITEPNFTAATLPEGITSVNHYTAPAFADLDGDGDVDLLVGDDRGDFTYFQNTGTATEPNFTAATLPEGIVSVSGYATPAFADLDGDGDADLLVGNGNAGNLIYFENTSTVLRNAALVLEKIDLQYHALSKTLEIHSTENLTLNSIQIFDVMGKMMHQTPVKTQGDLSITLQNLSSGIYMVQVHTNQGKFTRKIGVH